MEPLTFYFKQEFVLPKIGALASSEEEIEQMKAESIMLSFFSACPNSLL